MGPGAACAIATEELNYATSLIYSRNFRNFEAVFIALAIYLTLSVLARKLLMWAGPRFVFGRRSA